MRYVLQNFPPSTHPKLYPQPIEHYERWLRNFARVNLAIVVAGLLIIVGLILGTLGGEWDGAIVTPWSTSGEWDAAIVTPFFLVQVARDRVYDSLGPQAPRSDGESSRPACARRSCDRGELVDFVSPAMLIVAALTNVAFIAFVLYYRAFRIPLVHCGGEYRRRHGDEPRACRVPRYRVARAKARFSPSAPRPPRVDQAGGGPDGHAEYRAARGDHGTAAGQAARRSRISRAGRREPVRAVLLASHGVAVLPPSERQLRLRRLQTRRSRLDGRRVRRRSVRRKPAIHERVGRDITPMRFHT